MVGYIVYLPLPIEMSLIHGFMDWQVGDLDRSSGKKQQKSGMASSAGNRPCIQILGSKRSDNFLAWGTQGVENIHFKKP